MQASSSKSCNACRLHCPDRGAAAFGVARRFGLLLLSAAALPILWECTVISAYRQSLQCGERSNAAFRKQSAAEKTSLAPHDSKARLLLVTSSRGSWRSHVHCTYFAQRVQFFELQTANVRGQGARPLAFSWGFKGDILSRERISPLSRAAPTALPSPRHQCRKSLAPVRTRGGLSLKKKISLLTISIIDNILWSKDIEYRYRGVSAWHEKNSAR